MQGRASAFAKLQASLRAAAFGGLACLALTGCASTSETRAAYIQKDMLATAQDFTSAVQSRGWVQSNGPGAVSVLLNGGAQSVPTAAEAYLTGKGALDMQQLAQAVVADLNVASDKTETLALAAEACASGKADPARARANLSALERALIVAKRMRTTFASAVDRVRIAMTPSDARHAQERLAVLEQQINRLDSAADLFAEAQRGV